MKKIVALLGDYYHQEEHARAALLKALAEELAEEQINLLFVKEPAALMEELANGTDAVILFADNRRTDPVKQPDLCWLTTECSERIVRYVEGGGGWLAWHSGLASYPADSGYVGMLRGYFLSHPAQNPVRYTPVGNREASEFELLLDEHYFVHCDEDNTEVYLRSTSVDGQSVAGWRHPFGAGRVSCLTPAHRPEGLLDDHFIYWLNREINWMIGSDV
ncbi:ThuA domain-containing protein [Paenibacillus harenae]|uniref:ThuA domain-containing protein n=1 Tax=Paenibacillus harenae TaxID=306543 RepID=UPI0003FDCC14|nr:ThuA domain-containing protein [Paenibacillus harenae]